MRTLTTALSITLAASALTPSIAQSGPGWSVGPEVRGRNYSRGVELERAQRGLWQVTIMPGAELDGVTAPRGPIAGSIKLRYRVSGGGLTASDASGATPILSLYVQRAGDDWSARGRFSTYRWYSTTPLPLTPGEHSIVVPLTPDRWHSVTGAGAKDLPREFFDALASRGVLGVGFGSWDGRMHGVQARAPVKFEMISFDVG